MSATSSLRAPSFFSVSAYLTRTAPDARFYLPGVSLLTIAAVPVIMKREWPRMILLLATVVCVMQMGATLAKVHKLRHVSFGMKEGIRVLENASLERSKIFMYPEGNYRLFPYQPVWYLDNRLKDFWRETNEERMVILNACNIGAIVVKKHMVAPIDPEMHNLMVYPPEFVSEIGTDPRIERMFENDAVIIFKVHYPQDWLDMIERTRGPGAPTAPEE